MVVMVCLTFIGYEITQGSFIFNNHEFKIMCSNRRLFVVGGVKCISETVGLMALSIDLIP